MKLNSVLVYRDKLLPISETFVLEPSLRLKKYDAFFLGSTFDPRGMMLPQDRVFALNPEGSRTITNKNFHKELCFKVAGIQPKDVKRWIRSLSPKLIHAYFAFDGALVIPIARSQRVPIIVSLLGTDITLDEKTILRRSHLSHRLYVYRKKKLFQVANKFIVPSMFLWKKALERGYPEEKLVLLPHGVDLNKFMPDLTTVEFGRILYVGRLIQLKGLPFLIKAVAALKKDFPYLKLIVIGDGPKKQEYVSLGKRILGSSIEFLGAQPSNVVAEEMRKSYVFSLPSIQMPSGETETFGLVHAEAQASGVPVVAFRVGGVPEVVQHGKTGFLASPEKIEELTEYLHILLSNPELRKNMAVRSRNFAEEQFDLEKRTSELESMYDEILGN